MKKKQSDNRLKYLAGYLAVVALISGVILLTVQLLTRQAIINHSIREKNESLSLVMPKAVSFDRFDLNLPLEKQTIFKGLDQKKETIGYVFVVSGKGYSSVIEMLVGITEKKITGVTVLSQGETPGLGTVAVDKKPLPGRSFSFLAQFQNKSILDSFKAKEDVIAITGATITSQAISDAIKQAVKIYNKITYKPPTAEEIASTNKVSAEDSPLLKALSANAGEELDQIIQSGNETQQ
ncbi:MAG: FMN-binding protein [Candidatus Margulisbacteria bacterium]|nr:FMN-binding protein [Candidatus Margulisiibacteriota bacterium]